MGRSEFEVLRSKLIVYVNEENYREALKLISSLSESLPQFSREEAMELIALISELQKKLKEKEEKLLKSIADKLKVKGSYLKCSS